MEKSTHTPEYAIFLEVLQETRHSAGLTQVELAQKLRQTQSYISKYERGEARIDIVQLRMICVTLGTTLPTFIRHYEKRLAELKGSRRPSQ